MPTVLDAQSQYWRITLWRQARYSLVNAVTNENKISTLHAHTSIEPLNRNPSCGGHSYQAPLRTVAIRTQTKIEHKLLAPSCFYAAVDALVFLLMSTLKTVPWFKSSNGGFGRLSH